MTTNALEQHIHHPQMLADTLQVSIVSAEREMYSGRAKVVVARAEEGDLGIFPGHTQLLATLKPGEVKLVSLEGKEDYFYVSGGFIEVQPHIVTILADTVMRATEIDEQQAEEAKARAEKILASKNEDVNYTAALIELSKAIAQLKVAKRKH